MRSSESRTQELLEQAASRGIRYLENLENRSVFPTAESVRRLAHLGGPLGAEPMDATKVVALLDEIGSAATVASTGRRYFGFVTGGALPVTVGANWLAGAWDQNAGLEAQSPVSAALEEIARGWLVEILRLPEGTGVGFVTGATMANFTALAAARHTMLERAGWDVEAQGLFGAPAVTVIVGDEVHVSVLKALMMLGLGRNRLLRVPADAQGRMRVDALPRIAGPTIVCMQAGN